MNAAIPGHVKIIHFIFRRRKRRGREMQAQAAYTTFSEAPTQLLRQVREVTIDFAHINYTFQYKPLLFGDSILQCLGLRESSYVDLLLDMEDFAALRQIYPYLVYIDLNMVQTIIIGKYKFHNSYMGLYCYEDLLRSAKQYTDFLIISIMRFYEMKSLDIGNPQSARDLWDLSTYLMERHRVSPLVLSKHQHRKGK